MSDTTFICGNGIRADTGEYGVTLALEDLYAALVAERDAADEEKVFVQAQEKAKELKSYGPPPSVKADDLAEAHWGILWPPTPASPAEATHQAALQAALAALIEHRRKQMGGKEPHEFKYQSGWTYDQFLWQAGPHVITGQMKVEKIPYYLCIAGSPEQIPWEFQQYLDGEYAVGRLWFEDPEDCKQYVQHLITYEEMPGDLPTSRTAMFAGTRHPNDPATQSSASRLVQPLYAWLTGNSKLDWDASLLLGDQPADGASKANLRQALDAAPALWFTAGHGVEEAPSEVQYARQGALVLQDWVGGPILPEHALFGSDVDATWTLAGMMAFCFACYSAGAPREADWMRPDWFEKLTGLNKVALRPFVAHLPQKLLAHGLLAFIGHVSKTWSFSFLGPNKAAEQITAFSETLGELLHGRPAGHATDTMNRQWSALTVLLDRQVQDKKKYTKQETIDTWMARNDFRGYVTLGDPAVRIRAELVEKK